MGCVVVVITVGNEYCKCVEERQHPMYEGVIILTCGQWNKVKEGELWCWRALCSIMVWNRRISYSCPLRFTKEWGLFHKPSRKAQSKSFASIDQRFGFRRPSGCQQKNVLCFGILCHLNLVVYHDAYSILSKYIKL